MCSPKRLTGLQTCSHLPGFSKLSPLDDVTSYYTLDY